MIELLWNVWVAKITLASVTPSNVPTEEKFAVPVNVELLRVPLFTVGLVSVLLVSVWLEVAPTSANPPAVEPS